MILFGSVYFTEVKKVLNEPQHYESTKCYDRYSNEIENVTCKKLVYDNEEYNGISGIANGLAELFAFLAALIGLAIFIIGWGT